MRDAGKVALAGGGLALVGWALWRSSASGSEVGKAMAQASAGVAASFDARLTTYWPWAARADEKAMEGGTKDRKGKPLYALEDALAGKAPFVSVSGDDAIFPYGQLLTIDAFPGVPFRVVDTGQHFRGVHKVYRAAGREPLDICVRDRANKVPSNVRATIVPGDTFDKPSKAVAVSKFQGQTVGLDLLGGRVA